MKFDVIIGNPPYQINDGGGLGASAKPIYNKFIEMGIKLNPKYLTMIVPSRWMSGGRRLDTFRKKMLDDNRISHIYDFKNNKECFKTVVIKGGVNYFLWDKNYNGLCEYNQILNNNIFSTQLRKLNEYDIFVRDNFGLNILNKVLNKENNFLNEKVFNRNPFGLRANFKDYKDIYFKDAIKLYGNKNLMKDTNGIGYIDLKSITKNRHLINKHKVLISKASGTGNDKKILGNPFYIEQNSVCSETYLVVDDYDTKNECKNMIKYIKTKFFRFLISLRKNTQNTTKATYSFVPDLPMTEEWTSEKLYKRYNLTKDEIKYIEDSIIEII